MRKFASTIFLYSPKAYSYIRAHFHLPAVSTIRRWLSHYDCRPGYFRESLEFLSSQISKNPWLYGECSLMLDGMAIRKKIEWDSSTKRNVGYVDYGAGPEGDIEATEALVFMAVGLVGSWKLPIGYALINCKSCI